MKKKLLSTVLAAATCVSMLAGCGSSDGAGTDKGADNTAENTAEAEGGEALSASDIKIGVIYIGDENEGYTAAHMEGIDQMQAALGISDDQIIEKTLVPEDESCTDAAEDMVDQGCNIIFATSFGHESYLMQVAAEYPEIQFCHATGYQAASSVFLISTTILITSTRQDMFQVLLQDLSLTR